MSFYEQDKELIEKFIAGQSQAKIARDLDISRERVRQRLGRNGFKGRNYRWIPERKNLISVLEESTSLAQAASFLKITELQLHTAIKHHGLSEVFENAKARWKTHRREEYYLSQQRPRIAQVRELALKLGHTPRQKDLQASGISHTTLIHTFGSLPNAMISAGLIPNRHRYISPLPSDFVDLDTAVAEPDEILHKANLLRRIYADIPEPKGVKTPVQKTIATLAYYRDPRVVAWVLQQADGICEVCGEQGYETDSGIAYLEVHHVVPLSEGGPDTTSNVIATCETCHGKLHRAKNREELKANLYRNLARLRVPDEAILDQGV